MEKDKERGREKEKKIFENETFFRASEIENIYVTAAKRMQLKCQTVQAYTQKLTLALHLNRTHYHIHTIRQKRMISRRIWRACKWNESQI